MANLGILVPIALTMGCVGLMAFLWSLRSDQYEDLDGAGVRILLDDVNDEGLVKGRTHVHRHCQNGRKTKDDELDGQTADGRCRE